MQRYVCTIILTDFTLTYVNLVGVGPLVSKLQVAEKYKSSLCVNNILALPAYSSTVF